MKTIGSSQQVVGQISQVKHQLDSRLEIGSGYEMEVAEYELGFNDFLDQILEMLRTKLKVWWKQNGRFDWGLLKQRSYDIP